MEQAFGVKHDHRSNPRRTPRASRPLSSGLSGSAKMKVLDLFCGAGGASMGYHKAGFEVVGVDIKPQPHYPFEFIQADALEFLEQEGLNEFDLIHSSPPCQLYSTATPVEKRKNWPDLIPPLRVILNSTYIPYVIENVPGAPLYGITLCGVMFGKPIARHRVFEVSFHIEQPIHIEHPEGIVQITGGGPCNSPARPGIGGARRKPTANGARQIMEMPWATKAELNEAIPPVYTEYIGLEFLKEFGGK